MHSEVQMRAPVVGMAGPKPKSMDTNPYGRNSLFYFDPRNTTQPARLPPTQALSPLLSPPLASTRVLEYFQHLLKRASAAWGAQTAC